MTGPKKCCTEYTCQRCGYSTDEYRHYLRHVNRKVICKPNVCDVLPTLSNPTIMKKHNIRGQIVTIETANVSTNPSTSCLGNNVVGNNVVGNNNVVSNSSVNNNVNVHIALTVPEMRPCTFPIQDYSHLSPEFVNDLLATATRCFTEAVKKLFDVSYFDTKCPHNMNVLVPPSQPDVAYVYNKHNDGWVPRDMEQASDQMVQEPANSLSCIADEQNMPQHIVDELEKAFDEGLYLQDEALRKHVKETAKMASLRALKLARWITGGVQRASIAGQ